MDELLYNTLNSYYNALSVVGYKKDFTVYKILVIQYIYELLNSEYRFYLIKNDIKLMQDLLYQFIGSTCEISFPTNCRRCCSDQVVGPIDPSITDFSLIPETTVFVDSQDVTFTGFKVTIDEGNHIKENSLKVYWNSDILVDNLSTAVDTITFDAPIIKSLVAGQTYEVKASVLDSNNIEYFSNKVLIVCESKPVPPEELPSISGFKLVPSTSQYAGAQDVTFTGAMFVIEKGTKFKENSLEILWNSEVIGTGLDTNDTAVTFDTPITKSLEVDVTYIAKASVEDIDGNKYFSNEFIIKCVPEGTPDPEPEPNPDPDPPVETPLWMYTRTLLAGTTLPPADSRILESQYKYDYNKVKTFKTPVSDNAGDYLLISVPAPGRIISVSRVSENTGNTVYLYGGPDNKTLSLKSGELENGVNYVTIYTDNSMSNIVNYSWTVVVQ